jgi:hypothetical protein
MARRIPLLDGNVIDLDRVIDSNPTVGPETYARDKVQFYTSFETYGLPAWLDYYTDSGPSEPTFNPLSSTDKPSITLSTGSGSADDVTALVGPTITVDEWSRVAFYVLGASSANQYNVALNTVIGDSYIAPNNQEGFALGTYDNGTFSRIEAGGNKQNTAEGYAEAQFKTGEKHSYGIRLDETDHPESAGHSLHWVIDGTTRERWDESNGWPNTTDLTMSFAVQTLDGSAQTATVEGIYIELIR